MSNLALQKYATLDDAECEERIRAAKERLGERAVILGHHYQREEVFRHADYSGDSLKLSRLAANSKAEYIVFCGVHFMAEVADILSRPDQVSILPDLAAGCSMADMANLAKVQRGLHAARHTHVTFARYQETKIRHFHALLGRWLHK